MSGEVKEVVAPKKIVPVPFATARKFKRGREEPASMRDFPPTARRVIAEAYPRMASTTTWRADGSARSGWRRTCRLREPKKYQLCKALRSPVLCGGG